MPLLCRLRRGNFAAPLAPPAETPASPSSVNARTAVAGRGLSALCCRCSAAAAALPFLLSAPSGDEERDRGRCWCWCGCCRGPRHASMPEAPGRKATPRRSPPPPPPATSAASLPNLRLTSCLLLAPPLLLLLLRRHPGHRPLPGCWRTPCCCSCPSSLTLVGAVLAAAAPVAVPRYTSAAASARKRGHCRWRCRPPEGRPRRRCRGFASSWRCCRSAVACGRGGGGKRDGSWYGGVLYRIVSYACMSAACRTGGRNRCNRRC